MSSNVSGVRPDPELLPLLFIPEPLPLKPPEPEPDKPNKPIIILALPPLLSLTPKLPGTPLKRPLPPPPPLQHGLREAAILCHLLWRLTHFGFLVEEKWEEKTLVHTHTHTHNTRKKEEEQKGGLWLPVAASKLTHTRTETHTQHTARKFDKRVIRRERKWTTDDDTHTNYSTITFALGPSFLCVPKKLWRREHTATTWRVFQVIRFFCCYFPFSLDFFEIHTTHKEGTNDFTCVFVCVCVCCALDVVDEDRDNTHSSAPLLVLTKDGRMFVYYRKKGAGPNSPFFLVSPLRAFDLKQLANEDFPGISLRSSHLAVSISTIIRGGARHSCGNREKNPSVFSIVTD